MADSRDGNTSEHDSTKDITMDEAEADATLLNKTTNKVRNHLEMGNLLTQDRTPMTIRYEIPVRRGKSLDASLQLHLQLLHHLDTTFRAQELQIYDNKLRRVSDFAAPKWLENEYYDSHFDHKVDTNTNTIVLTHQIHSTAPLATLKDDPIIAIFLLQSKTSLRQEIHNHTTTQNTSSNDTLKPPPSDLNPPNRKERSKNTTNTKALHNAHQNVTPSTAVGTNLTPPQQTMDDDASATTMPTGRTPAKEKTLCFLNDCDKYTL
jgi:hypothetical protein